ncbi:MAG: hypothetical protein ACYC96_13770 [Fimbriimonadaceae bacterium]
MIFTGKRIPLVVALVTLFAAVSSGTVLTLPASTTRSRASTVQRADALVRSFANAATQLTLFTRRLRTDAGRYHGEIPFSLPTVVRLAASGNSLRGGGGGGIHSDAGGDLVLQFDATGAEAFPTAYQQLLQNVFNSAKSTLDIVFGMPAVGGVVHVANFDASIGDRDAIAGGYYLPDNGAGVPEIRFPVYNANETAAVNFIHCLLLAYLGPDGYAWDGFEEGLVRAVTMKVARTTAALPAGLDPGVIQTVLENSYDIAEAYDWDNQRPLSGATFIAANLRALPLPVSGGSGPYLLRYLMSGSAWAKVLIEYPTFAASLNALVYATPSLGSNLPGLTTAAQGILTAQRPTDATIEGLSFAAWLQRQYVLDPTATQGSKVLVDVTPLTTGLIAGDFGVFIVEATYFSTDGAGNETLLSGTSYPIYWDSSFNRISTSPQDEQLDITASQGSVVPNLPDLFNGSAYRGAIDVPVGDQLQRVFVPVGAIATVTTTTPSDFYGTIEGANTIAGDTMRVDVLVGGTVIATAPVANNAFGISIGAAGGFSDYASLTLNVVRTRAAVDTTLLTRTVNKTPGSLDVDLRVVGDGTFTYSTGLAGGLSFIGLPIDPYSSDASAILGVPAADLLLARYDSALANYALFPSLEPLTLGHGYFVNLPAAQNSFTVTGRMAAGISTTVPLKPGWNMVSPPLAEVVPTTSTRVVHAADFPDAYADAVGTLIGTDFFRFQPGQPDPITGLPEGGTFVQATEFDPGVGYFVRVLAPEGVSLAFDADTSLLKSVNTAKASGWQMRFSATANGRTTTAIIGGAANGSDTLSFKVDSTLPPPIAGGLQAYSVNGDRLFRDIRPINTRQAFNLHVDGLTAGQSYVIRFTSIVGRSKFFTVVDRATGQARMMYSGASWPLQAYGSSATLYVVVPR